MQKLILLFVAFISLNCIAQKDTLFWFAAPDFTSGSGDSPVGLQITSYSQAPTITISCPANGSFLPIIVNLASNATQTVDLSSFLASIESAGDNIIGNKGLKIHSTQQIACNYFMDNSGNKELFSLKGTRGIGTNFYLPFQNSFNNGITTPASHSSFEVVATENGTTVLISPRTNITGHVQNVSYSISLNAGQTYSGRDVTLTSSSTLSGSIISSNKPIAVTVHEGDLQNTTCIDAVGDQLTTTDFLGKQYILSRNSSTDKAYIVAVENNTAITITNSSTSSIVLNWGQTHSVSLDVAHSYINANKGIYVYYVGSFGCQTASAQLPGISCAGNNDLNFSRVNSDSLYLLLYTRAGFEGNFLLNGSNSAVSASNFSTVPGTSGEFVAAKILISTTTIPVGSFNRLTNSTDIFGAAIMYGNHNESASLAYLTEFSIPSYSIAGNDATSCANIPFPISGIVGGGPITGAWYTSGFGTFENGPNGLINNYIPSPLDTLTGIVKLSLYSTGVCPVAKDTLTLIVTPAPIVNAAADQVVCANNATVVLQGNIQGGTTTGVWSTTGIGSFTPDNATLNASYTPSIADLIFGNVKLFLTSTNNGGCAVVKDSMIINYTIGPNVNALQDTVISCNNNPSVSVSGTVSGSSTTGKWIAPGGGIFTPNNLSLSPNYQPTQSEINAGFSFIYLESTNNGTCLPVRDTIVLEFVSAANVNAGANEIACSNSPSVNLNGSITGISTSGVWSGGNGTFSNINSLTSNYTATPVEISSGVVNLTLTSTNNGLCNAVNDIVTINFITPPNANFSIQNKCLGVPINVADLSLAGAGTLNSWSYTFSSGGTANVGNTTITPTSTGSFTANLIVENSFGCSNSISKPFQVFAKPTADFIFSATCPNNNAIVNFTDQSTGSATLSSWFYDFGGSGTSFSQNPVQIFSLGGTYTISLAIVDVNGCKDTIEKPLQADALPNAGFTYNSNNGFNVGAVFNFVDTSSNAIDYLWNFGNGQSSIIQNPSSTYFGNGTYKVSLTVHNAIGCVDSTFTLININTITDDISQLIPNAISPNEDGKNDVWKLDFIELLYPDATVNVFNEWGQELYSSKGYKSPWDGKINGDYLPDGTYFYVIDLIPSIGDAIFKGTVLILKQR